MTCLPAQRPDGIENRNGFAKSCSISITPFDDLLSRTAYFCFRSKTSFFHCGRWELSKELLLAGLNLWIYQNKT